MGGLRELHSHGSLNHFYGYFFQVSFGQFFFLFKYLFIYLPVLGLSFSMQDLCCGGIQSAWTQ